MKEPIHMEIKPCVGCGKGIWWGTDKPPICKVCAGDPAPIIADLQRRNKRGSDEHKQLQKILSDVVKIGEQQAEEWDRFWDAMGVKSQDVSIDDAIAKYKAMREVVDAAKTPCVWTQQEDEDCNEWESSCGDLFYFEEGTPKENSIKFCPFCSHPVTEKAYEPPSWDDEE